MPWVSVVMLVFLATPAAPTKPGQRRPEARPPAAAPTKPRPTSAPKARPAAARPAAAKPAAKPADRTPKAAKPTAARPADQPAAKGADRVAARPAPAAKPAVRVVAPRPSAAKSAQRAAPKRRSAPRKAKARPAPRKRPAPPALPFFEDKSVRQIRLKNGLVCWCKTLPHAGVTQLKLAVAAGSATDPKGLAGTASFLAALLKKSLNQPKNPPHSSVPMGGSYYDVKVHKDWTVLQVQLQPGRIEESLTHIAKGLKGPLPSIVPEPMRKALVRAAGKFPPPALLERVEAYLFRGQPHGRLARGKKSTFKNIQWLRLQTSWKALFRAHRMRLLIVGRAGCEEVGLSLSRTLAKLPDQTNQKDKTPLYIKSKTKPSGRLFLTQELMHLYQLPSLARADFVPLWLLERIAAYELQHRLSKSYGPFPVRPAIQPFAHNGYLLFSLPSHTPQRRALDKAVKKALGTLRMQPYPPALKQRIQMRYRTQIDLHVRSIVETSQGAASLLFPQLLLPAGKEKRPQAILPLVEQMKPEMVRYMARKFMHQQVAFRPGTREFTFPRVILFVVTLLLIWVLLDQTFRRNNRRNDE